MVCYVLLFVTLNYWQVGRQEEMNSRFDNTRAIRRELELYSPALAARPELLVVTKLDLTGSGEAGERIAHELCREVIPISAVTGKGIPTLVHRLGDLLDRLPAPADPAGLEGPRPGPAEGVGEPQPEPAGAASDA